jgi:hypothetical protein
MKPFYLALADEKGTQKVGQQKITTNRKEKGNLRNHTDKDAQNTTQKPK